MFFSVYILEYQVLLVQQVKRGQAAQQNHLRLGKSNLKAATVGLRKARKCRRILSRETLRYVKVHVGLDAVLGCIA